jgi:hypothetical protein
VRHTPRVELSRYEAPRIPAQKGREQRPASEHRGRSGSVDHLSRRGNTHLVRPVYGTGFEALEEERTLHRGRPANK